MLGSHGLYSYSNSDCDERCGRVGARPHRAKYLYISSVNKRKVEQKTGINKDIIGLIMESFI